LAGLSVLWTLLLPKHAPISSELEANHPSAAGNAAAVPVREGRPTVHLRDGLGGTSLTQRGYQGQGQLSPPSATLPTSRADRSALHNWRVRPNVGGGCRASPLVQRTARCRRDRTDWSRVAGISPMWRLGTLASGASGLGVGAWVCAHNSDGRCAGSRRSKTHAPRAGGRVGEGVACNVARGRGKGGCVPTYR